MSHDKGFCVLGRITSRLLYDIRLYELIIHTYGLYITGIF